MTAEIIAHPAARLPATFDATGQGWLPPLWLWPESYAGSWEWRHEPEYLVAIGLAASFAEASVMLIQARLAAAWRKRVPAPVAADGA